MTNLNPLLSPGLINRIHTQCLSALAALQSTGRLASSMRIDRPGTYRQHNVIIRNSAHVPPSAENVPSMIQTLCDYLNMHHLDMDPIDAACLALWRINWIHPFRDGNGRTARAATRHVIAVCYKLNIGNELDQRIVTNRTAYYDALRSEDDNQDHSGTIQLPGRTLHSFMRKIITEHLN